jgi:hypothetical protein
MRKVGIVIGTIVFVLIVAVVVFAATFNVNQYRRTIQSELEKRLNRRVVLGDMRLGILPPRLMPSRASGSARSRKGVSLVVTRILSSWRLLLLRVVMVLFPVLFQNFFYEQGYRGSGGEQLYAKVL